MNTKIRKKQENLHNEELKDHLYARLEIEWDQNRNADFVDELAFQYPDLANELYEFFALLIELEIGDEENGEDDNSKNPLLIWLEKEGMNIALEAANNACHNTSTSPIDSNSTDLLEVKDNTLNKEPEEPRTTGRLISRDKFLRAAQKREKMKGNEIATEIKTPLPIILIAEENQDPQFDPWRDEISNRYSDRFGRNRNEIRNQFSEVRAVARTGTTTMKISDIEVKIKKLKIPKSEKEFWLKLLGMSK